MKSDNGPKANSDEEDQLENLSKLLTSKAGESLVTSLMQRHIVTQNLIVRYGGRECSTKQNVHSNWVRSVVLFSSERNLGRTSGVLWARLKDS